MLIGVYFNVSFTEAIKHMKKFSKFYAIDVETPLRTFISGAKFRDTSKKAELDTHNSTV